MRRAAFGSVVFLMAMAVCGKGRADFTMEAVAGRGIGDGRPGTAATLDSPTGLAIAGDGSLLIADWLHARIRRLDLVTGVITTRVGLNSGTTGDGLPADRARLKGPLRVRVAPSGDLLIAEFASHRIRVVGDASGMVSTIAGGADVAGSSGDGGLAVDALLNGPADAIPDGSGGVLIADFFNHKIRRVDGSGVIETVVGTGAAGYSGDGGDPALATLSGPVCLLLGAGGEFYICDRGNHVIRKVSGGVITTVAGTGIGGFDGDGDASSHQLHSPVNLAFDSSGNLIIADQDNNRVRQLDLMTGQLSTIAGTGVAAYGGENVPATTSSLAGPNGVELLPDGRLVIAEQDANRVRVIDGGNLITLAGDGIASFGGDGGPALDATFGEVKSVAVDGSGNLFISDAGNHRLRRVDGMLDTVTTVAGNGSSAFSGDDGPATSAGMSLSGIAISPDELPTIADSENHRIRQVDLLGSIHSIAGTGLPGFAGDGLLAVDAQLNSPVAVNFDDAGNLYVADFGNNRIRRIDTSGVIETVAGNGNAGYNGDGILATDASLFNPTDVAVDGDGNLYIADFNNHRIRMVDATSGLISTVAGTGSPGSAGDFGAATAAELNLPSGIRIDVAGELIIADSGNHVVRLVDAVGDIRTIAGSFIPGSSGDNGLATSARLLGALRLLPLEDGRILVADRFNFRIRALVPEVSDEDGDGVSDAQDGCLGSPTGAAVDASGCACADPGHVSCDDANPCTADTCNVGTAACEHPAGNAGTECRGSAGACDVAESCTGTSATCPADTGGHDQDADGVCDGVDPCTDIGGTQKFLSKPTAKVVAARVNTDPNNGNDKLSLAAEFVMHGGAPFSAINPQANGVRVLVTDSSGTASRFDVTLPVGEYRGRGTRGWKPNRARTTWTYLDRTGAPLGGLLSFRVTDRSTKGAGRVRVIVRVINGSTGIVAADIPLRSIVVLGGQMQAQSGYCGESNFDAGDCTLSGRRDTITCKR